MPCSRRATIPPRSSWRNRWPTTATPAPSRSWRRSITAAAAYSRATSRRRSGCAAPANRADTEAAMWFRVAASQGDAVAQFYLGVMYNEGRGVPQDYAEAAKWYKLADEQGDALAQDNLCLF